MSVPNVLATRYASEQLRAIWAPEAKVVAERRLWLVVLRAQRDLGVDFGGADPGEVIAAYEAVTGQVDLESMASRERVTRHDVKARIEEFNALAGYEHIHKGMTSRDLTENIEQYQVLSSLRLIRDRVVAVLAHLARLAVTWAGQPLTGRSHNVAAQITTLGKRFATAADELLVAYRRLEELIARYPARGIKGPVGTAQDMLDLLGGDAGKLAELERRVRRAGFRGRPDLDGAGVSPQPRLRRRDRAGADRRRPVEHRDHNPPDGRAGAGHRGVQGGPGWVVGHAPQDEHPLL